MGFFDKLAGKPKEARKASTRREDRHAERMNMRASRDSSNWQPSPTPSQTGGYSGYQSHSYGGHPPVPLQSSGSRRVSSPASRRHSMSEKQQPSPAMSPRYASAAGGAPGMLPSSSSHHYTSSGQLKHSEIQPANSGSQAQQQQHAEQVKELQKKIQSMEAQIQEVEGLKHRLLAEQRTALDWREKWNYQNFKLNLMVDMLVLQALDSEGAVEGLAGARGPTAGSALSARESHTTMAPSLAASLSKPMGEQVVAAAAKGGMVGVGRQAASRRGADMMEEDFDE